MFRLTRNAIKLIDSLGGEKGSWKELGQDLRVYYERLTGDVLVSSGMIAYLGLLRVLLGIK